MWRKCGEAKASRETNDMRGGTVIELRTGGEERRFRYESSSMGGQCV
jgi:hypothetical protein